MVREAACDTWVCALTSVALETLLLDKAGEHLARGCLEARKRAKYVSSACAAQNVNSEYLTNAYNSCSKFHVTLAFFLDPLQGLTRSSFSSANKKSIVTLIAQPGQESPFGIGAGELFNFASF